MITEQNEQKIEKEKIEQEELRKNFRENFTEEAKLKIMRKELQDKINKCNFCWGCGRKVYLTKHHAIPQRVDNIVMNVTVPVCSNCKELIHKYDELIGIIKKVFLR